MKFVEQSVSEHSVVPQQLQETLPGNLIASFARFWHQLRGISMFRIAMLFLNKQKDCLSLPHLNQDNFFPTPPRWRRRWCAAWVHRSVTNRPGCAAASPRLRADGQQERRAEKSNRHQSQATQRGNKGEISDCSEDFCWFFPTWVLRNRILNLIWPSNIKYCIPVLLPLGKSRFWE